MFKRDMAQDAETGGTRPCAVLVERLPWRPCLLNPEFNVYCIAKFDESADAGAGIRCVLPSFCGLYIFLIYDFRGTFMKFVLLYLYTLFYLLRA